MLKSGRESKEYKGSEMEKKNIKKLDKLETELDRQLKPYIDFEIIKKF